MSEQFLTEIYKLLANDSQKTFREIIEERKALLGVPSDLQLAKMTDIDKNTLTRILDGETQKIDLFSILKISQFLGINIDEMVQIYVASLKPEFVKELELARKANFIIRTFDINGLKKCGFIKANFTFEQIEKQINTFFGLESIYHYNEEVANPALFSRTKVNSNDKLRDFWVRSAVLQFRKIGNPNEYDREALQSLITRMRPYTRNEDKGLLTVIQALYNIGITVIVQSHLYKTQVRGGTFVLDNKPCIVITTLNDKYPTLWFALMHELYHVLFDFDHLKGYSYHLTGAESDLMLFMEDDADDFAVKLLFPIEKLEFVKHIINNHLLVEDYAEKNSVHSSIIYSFYCAAMTKQGKNVWSYYSKYIPNTVKAVKTLKTHPWDKETINEEVEKIKHYLIAK